MKRSYQNQGAYGGETIRIGATLERLGERAAAHGWSKTELSRAGPHPVWALERSPVERQPDAPRIYVSAGIHGDEPAGPLAVAQLIEAGAFSPETHWFMCPCLNPVGFDMNRRSDSSGTDLNRGYREPQSALVRAHSAWLESLPRFDAALLLHEDWEADGFYLYELCREPARAMSRSIIDEVSRVCPVHVGDQIDGWPVRRGVVRPGVDPMERPEWPEALYLFMRKTDLCYTFEAPSDYDLELRTKALVTAVAAAVGSFQERSPG